MEMEEFLFDTQISTQDKKVFVLIIYDITDNKKRQKLAKLLMGYGFRVQKSAFESQISAAKYDLLLQKLQPFGTAGDSVRVYKISGKGQVVTIGNSDTEENTDQEDVIVI